MGFKANAKSPEVPFSRGFKALVAKYIFSEYLNGRKDFTIREIRVHPDFQVPKGTHNISSRITFLIERLSELEIPFKITRGDRGTFSVSCRHKFEFEEV